MSPWHAAQIGDPVDSIDTPALVLDLNAFERNLKRMADALKHKGVRLRAHAKSHKCPEIAKRQVALGAVGVCCQKISEAAVFVEAGIQDVLVTNQTMSANKVARLLALAKRARMGILVDHLQQVAILRQQAQSAQVPLDVYVEVNVGANRCGAAPGEEVLRLARDIMASPPLRFAGLHCYHGGAQHMRLPDDRRKAIESASDIARHMRDTLHEAGIPCDRITGAGTGTFWLERDSGIFNEVQAGSYVFMDRDYSDNQPGPEDLLFEHALFVRTTVMSHPTAERAIVDAGLKASSVDSGMPVVWQRPDLKFLKASDEHGVLQVAASSTLKLGDALMLVPGHCDPTVNLYDELVCVRDGHVEALWPISARGALL